MRFRASRLPLARRRGTARRPAARCGDRDCRCGRADPAASPAEDRCRRRRRRGRFPSSPGDSVRRPLFGIHVAFMHRALHQQPACRLHQPRGDAHAFAGIEHARSCAADRCDSCAAAAIEILRGLLDQRHAFLEGLLEQRRTGEALGVRSSRSSSSSVIGVMPPAPELASCRLSIRLHRASHECHNGRALIAIMVARLQR